MGCREYTRRSARAALAASLLVALALHPVAADEMPDEDAYAPPSAGLDASASDESQPEADAGPTAGERAERISSIAIDVVLVRLPSLAFLGIGCVFFAATTPFTAPSRQLGDAFDYMVLTPYDFALRRPIGKL